jgi:RND family efflux transporter MFP subunit
LQSHNGQMATTDEKPAVKSEDPKMGVRLGLSVAVVAIVLLAAFFIVHRRKVEAEELLGQQTAEEANAAPIVDVVSVKSAASSEPLVLPGDTRGWYESTIYARVSGYVGNWTSDIGDRVKKGQVLATIETPDLDQQLIAAQEKLKVSQAEVAVAEANASFAQKTYERWRDSPRGVVSEQEREEKEAEFNSSVAKLNAAKAQANADKADVGRLMALEEFKNVTAPYDGVITSRPIDVGDLVTAGSTSNTTSLYNIAQINEIRVFVDVPQRAAAGMVVGIPAIAVANEYPNRKFAGKIARSSRAIDPATRTLHVEVDIPNPDLALVPGMYLEVTFQLTHKGLLEVPASALIFRATGPQVAVVGPDNKVTFRDVSIAVDQGDFVELASGVSLDEKVALNISSEISDGDRVNAVDIDNTAGTRVAETLSTHSDQILSSAQPQ